MLKGLAWVLASSRVRSTVAYKEFSITGKSRRRDISERERELWCLGRSINQSTNGARVAIFDIKMEDIPRNGQAAWKGFLFVARDKGFLR